MLPKPLEKLINSIAFLPGIGEKTATKLAFFLLKANREYVANFAKDLSMLQNELVVCSRCGGYTDRENIHCNVCRSTQRDASLLCVVEDFLDMISLERLHIFQGYYHILGGSISPIHGIYPENLRFKELFDRLEKEPIREIIIAANPNIEWEATTLYLEEHIPNKSIKISRLSKGLPNAGSIEYADEITLINAFKGRK